MLIVSNRRLRKRWRTRGGLTLCSFYHESLHSWIRTIVNNFAISNHMALILGVHALRSCLKLFVNMSFIAYQMKKLVGQRIMVKTTSRSDRPWSAIFCVITYWITALCFFNVFVPYWMLRTTNWILKIYWQLLINYVKTHDYFLSCVWFRFHSDRSVSQSDPDGRHNEKIMAKTTMKNSRKTQIILTDENFTWKQTKLINWLVGMTYHKFKPTVILKHILSIGI